MKQSNLGYVVSLKLGVIGFYVITLLHIISLSRNVIFENVYTRYPFTSSKVEVNLCYFLDLNSKYCGLFNNTSIEKIKLDSTDNELSLPLACYTKNFENPKKLIEKLKQKKIDQWAIVKNVKEHEIKLEPQYELYLNQLCVKYKFESQVEQFENESTKLFDDLEINIQSLKRQPFDIYLSMNKKQANDTYRSKKKLLIKRNCWVKNDQTECLGDRKKFVMTIDHFSIKNLAKPYDTKCEVREEDQTQNDCYHECMKKDKKKSFYSLNYKEIDENELVFGDEYLVEDASKQCYTSCNLDCFVTEFNVYPFNVYPLNEYDIEKENENLINETDINETNTNETEINEIDINQIESPTNLFVINFSDETHAFEGVGFLNPKKTIWMILMSVTIFFGDIYNWLIKTTTFYNRTTEKSKSKVKKSGKKMVFTIFIFLIAFGLALVVEKKLTNFGHYEDPSINKTYLFEADSLDDRKLSLSVCYNLCEILIPNPYVSESNCNNQTLLNLSLKELNTSTWTIQDFKKRASFKITTKYWPIRQKRFEIVWYYRNFQKCFLVYYDSLWHYPHVAIMKNSIVHFTVSEIKYSMYFIGDGYGYNYPKMDAKPFHKSVLHNLFIKHEENKTKCLNYSTIDNDYHMNSKDDYIQECIIDKYIETKGKLPMFVNVRPGVNRSENYFDMKFEDETKLDRKVVELCRKSNKTQTVECEEKTVVPTDYELLEELKDDAEAFYDKFYFIVINLSPFIYEIKYFAQEDKFVIFNRLLSFSTMFACFSLAYGLKDLVTTYIYSIHFPNYNHELVSKLIYAISFYLFLFNLGLFIFYSGHSLNQIYYKEAIKKIEFPRFRLCYEHINETATSSFVRTDGLYHDYKGIVFQKVSNNSKNLNDFLEKIVLFDENFNETIIPFENYDPSNVTEENVKKYVTHYGEFYYDVFKCFSFNIIKTYDTSNENVTKLEKLMDMYIDTKQLERKRIFVFMNSDSIFHFDYYMPFYAGNTSIIFQTKENTLQDNYWLWKNFLRYILDYIGFKRSRQDRLSYLDDLSKAFEIEQYVTTTAVPLYPRKKNYFYKEEYFDPGDRELFQVKNRQFNSFIQFRSIQPLKKNHFYFPDNVRIISFPSIYLYHPNQTDNPTTIRLSYKSDLIKTSFIYSSTYSLMEFVVHCVALLRFWFNFNMIELPEIIETCWPIFKFICFLSLYLTVCFILWVCEMTSKLIKFIDFKYIY